MVQITSALNSLRKRGHKATLPQGYTYAALPQRSGKGKMDSALQALGETNNHHFYFLIIIVEEFSRNGNKNIV